MNVIKAGLIAGIFGLGLMIVDLVVRMYLARAFPVSEMGFIVLIAGLLVCAIPGALSGIIASRHVMSTGESLIPGLIAGSILALGQLLIVASLMLPAIGGPLHGLDLVMTALPYVLLRSPFTLALSGLCSALAVFFTRELYWNIPVLGQHLEPDGLNQVYDELWKDAQTLVIDMNRSIRVYLLAGILMLACGLVILGMGVAGWQYIHLRGAMASDYVIVICEIAGGIAQLIIGPYLLYWYYKLRKRYSRLMQMEKTLGA